MLIHRRGGYRCVCSAGGFAMNTYMVVSGDGNALGEGMSQATARACAQHDANRLGVPIWVAATFPEEGEEAERFDPETDEVEAT